MTNSDLVGNVILVGFRNGYSIDKIIEDAESLGFKVSEEFVSRHFKRIENHLKEKGKDHETESQKLDSFKSTRQKTISSSLSSPIRIKQVASRYTEL